jgi:hypothetical protein
MAAYACSPCVQVANAESVLTVHGSGASSRALRMVNVLNLYITNGAGQVGKRCIQMQWQGGIACIWLQQLHSIDPQPNCLAAHAACAELGWSAAARQPVAAALQR